tara:strand:+ start:92 stop:289 length:198 start_codon:yes stop_codon:yes gene_type:complete
VWYKFDLIIERSSPIHAKVALEEHFALEETQNPRALEELKLNLVDFEVNRLNEMDRYGIDDKICP